MTEKICRVLLRLYPADFRRQYGAELLSDLRLRLASARARSGWLGWVGAFMHESVDLVRSAIRERRSVRYRSAPSPHRGRTVSTLWQDLRYAVRTLRRAPGFTVVVVATLGLGIGANLAIFSVVNAVLLTPLPFPNPEELVGLWERNTPREVERNVVSPANFTDWRERNESFVNVAAYFQRGTNLTEDDGEPQRVTATLIYPSFFAVMGVPAMRGRTIFGDDDDSGQSGVAVLSHRLWQRRFGGEPDWVGRTITLDASRYEIVGVMPPSFDFPAATELWVTAPLGPAWRTHRGRFVNVVARLRPDVSLQRSQVEMTELGTRLEEEFPDFNTGWNVTVVGLHDQITGGVRPALLVLLGAVGLVLLLACANVANLLLGRAVGQTREVAIRSALGAGRSRILQQFFTEAGLLTVVALAVGTALALGAVRLLVAYGPGNIPRLANVSLDPRLFAFSCGIAAFTALAFGVLPALSVSRADAQIALREGGRTSEGAGRLRLRSALIVFEIAIALVLLVGAGLLTRSFQRLMDVDLGMAPDRVLTAFIGLPRSSYPDFGQQVGFFDRLLENVRAIPGVTSASAVSFLPLAGPGAATSYSVDARPEPLPGEAPVADVRAVQTDYFKTMRITLRRGRAFDGRERAGDALFPIVINEWMANEIWPGEDPLGKRITMNWFGDMHAEVIGVVDNVRHQGPDMIPRSIIYWAHAQFPYASMYLTVAAGSEPEALTPALRRELQAIDPQVPLGDVRTMVDRLGIAVAQRRFNMLLLGSLAIVAALMAAVGIYGVMSYAVKQRWREMGLRVALGAPPHSVIRLIVTQGMVLTGIAVVVGTVAALVAARLLASFMSGLLFEVPSTDPVTFAAVAVGLSAVALVACYLPARRAMGVDPITTLRVD